MIRLLDFSRLRLSPKRGEVFVHQGIPADREVTPPIRDAYQRALALYEKTALPTGMIGEISDDAFRDVFEGMGLNEPRTPVGEISERADHLFLFAVTLGERLCEEISRSFNDNQLLIGSMLNAIGSVAADDLAQVAQDHCEAALSETLGERPMPALMRYSPGYCGWHISAQRALFEFLGPGAIGITLRDSFLMDPIKSVTGVVIAGPAEIHRFKPNYPFCKQCKTHGCVERLHSVLG